MSKSNKEREYHIDFPSYSYEIIVVISKDVVKARRKRNKILGKLKRNFTAVALFSHVNAYEGYIFLPPRATTEVIAHECFHAIVHMLSSIDTKLSKKTEECFAYPLGYLVQKVHKYINQKK